MSMMRTAILMAALTALFMVAGFLIGGEGGVIIAFGVALVLNGFAYWRSDKMVLAMYGAQPATDRSAPELIKMVGQLADNAGLPMPAVYIIDNPQPNAFATGRDPAHAAVAATTGLLQNLSPQEVAGVMAHELAHIRNRDTLIMTITATLAGAISMLASVGLIFGGRNNNSPLGFVGVLLVALLAPMAAGLVQMAISRAREYEADRAGAQICGRPEWLASALERLETGAQAIDNSQAEANPATAHLFIVNPLHMRKLDGLFSTHPPMGDRIARLRAMARPNTARGPWG